MSNRGGDALHGLGWLYRRIPEFRPTVQFTNLFCGREFSGCDVLPHLILRAPVENFGPGPSTGVQYGLPALVGVLDGNRGSIFVIDDFGLCRLCGTSWLDGRRGSSGLGWLWRESRILGRKRCEIQRFGTRIRLSEAVIGRERIVFSGPPTILCGSWI